MWEAFLSYGAQVLSEKDRPRTTAGLLGDTPSMFGGAPWEVNFGKKPFSAADLPPWVIAAGVAAAGLVAIVAIKAFTK